MPWSSFFWMFPGGSYSKESVCNAEDTHLIPGLGRSPGEGSGNPLQYSCLENSMDRGAWWAKSMGLQRAGHNWATNTWLLLSSFTFIKRLFSSSSLSTVTVVSSAHLRLLTVLLAILIPAYSNSMIYKINKVWHLYCPTKRKILLGLDSTLYLNNGEILFYYSA